MNTELENRLAALSPDQIKALVQRVNKGAGPAQTGLQKVARQPGQRHPLSSAQERLWFLSQLSPESRVFNNPGALRAQTTAPLKRELFERSLNEVGRRHEILRTTFHSDDGKPVQEIHEHIDLRVGWQDISELPPEQREREAERIAIAEGRQTFDLATGPLITMKILRLGDLDYLLLITSHHIVSDGWSMAMFATEVASIYNAFENQRPHDLREPDLQFVDCVYRERDWMQGEKFRQHLDYWKQQLRAEPPPLALPTDHPRPRTMSDAGAMEKLMLSTTQAERLRTLAKQEGSSLFQVLIAAFKVLLSRYTGQEDIVVGTLAANRNRREFQNVMGLFMNTLPIRTHVSGDQTFREYLRSVQLVCQEALIHQELPFEKLIGELNPRRNLNTHPLFQVMFVHQNVPTLYVVPGMRLELFKVDYRTSKFDLNLWVEEINEELLLTLYYAEALFNPSTIKRMLSHYQTLLESVVADPATPIKHLPYFSRAERDFVLQRTHVSESLPSTRECFQRRFELQAERCPGSVAVECLDARLTYGQLNSQANQLARHLQRLQVGPGSLVAVLMERHPRTVVGLMGVMKAGGAYVPLDPTHPAGRIETILKNSETGVLVTEERFRSTVASLPVKAIYLDSEWSDIAENSDDNLDIELPDNQLVYVMYTSGTTGRPKGVCVEHRNLVNYCDAIWREMKLSQAHSFTTVSSLAADLGNTMIFPPLANGARVVIVPQDLATDAVGLATYFKERPVDCLKIVPSHLRALLKSSQARHILPAKLLMVGGEACPSDLVETIQGLNPSRHNWGSDLWSSRTRRRRIESRRTAAGVSIGRVPGLRARQRTAARTHRHQR